MLRKMAVLLLGMLLLVTPAYAAVYETELTDNEVLTVRLPDDGTPGRSWVFEVSDPSLVDLLTSEYAFNEENDKESGGEFAASFIAKDAEAKGDAQIIFQYKDEDEAGYVSDEVVLNVYVDGGEIHQSLAYSFCADVETLIVCLDANATTGYAWTYSVEGDLPLTLVSEDYFVTNPDLVGSPGVYMAVFATEGEAGSAVLTFAYARSWETEEPAHTLALDISYNADSLLAFALR